ncbi:GNAT family N-acetyltransferase [Simiduia agarivorans]|uniref:GNAT family acetyltransferase n=1 Tax=Simiduia agarivorans (strain DSM 21679 / JCM 13881 / BCRC 17597 / SA1) TaxID=1117647 RepID=K4KMF3_SIMAS|nr:GNAT family N-acetyltransferase [Simiduia agarivorans]AFV00182.1 GNAT family acetyltransferase [Simiduia agarivorans SA1 = DSM 21679]
MIKVRLAISSDLPALTGLFNHYRMFYQQPDDPAGAARYLAARLEAHQSLIWVAESGGQLLGFTQVYPSWCSVAMRPLWLLYDLYVAEAARARGVGAQLLEAAKTAAIAGGAVRMELATAVDNATAQRLYERNGWQREADFYRYSVSFPQSG